MNVLIVTSQLKGLSIDDYTRYCTEMAPIFAALPGLVSELWLADPEANVFGGVYLWESHEALEQYLASELFQGLTTNPFLENVSVRTFGCLDEVNALTAGPQSQISYHFA